MAFGRGDKVEVCMQDDGFRGSYYDATVVSHLPNDLYVVRYDLLLEDHSHIHSPEPLVETVRARELRPPPPPPHRSPAATFSLFDSVDAFDNDGWWVGFVSANFDASDGSYRVFFESTGDEISYPVSCLRPHLDWVRGKWVPPKKGNDKAKRAMILRERFQRHITSNMGLALAGNVGQ